MCQLLAGFLIHELRACLLTLMALAAAEKIFGIGFYLLYLEQWPPTCWKLSGLMPFSPAAVANSPARSQVGVIAWSQQCFRHHSWFGGQSVCFSC
jgi:hypothetical protein